MLAPRKTKSELLMKVWHWITQYQSNPCQVPLHVMLVIELAKNAFSTNKDIGPGEPLLLSLSQMGVSPFLPPADRTKMLSVRQMTNSQIVGVHTRRESSRTTTLILCLDTTVLKRSSQDLVT